MGRFGTAERFVLLLAFCFLGLFEEASCRNLDAVSFEAPFNKFRAGSGSRQVSATWYETGSTKVFKNFIRLTSDLPNEDGRLVLMDAIQFKQNTKVTMDFMFRVSGKGKTLFGDGFAFWAQHNPKNMKRNPLLTNQKVDPSQADEWLLGGDKNLAGFGILFDTFRNSAKGFSHKDVSFIEADGNDDISSDDFSKTRPHCQANFRYQEWKDSFSPLKDHSKARLEISISEEIRLTLRLDRKGNKHFGEKFDECFTVTLSDKMYRDYTQKDIYLGFSAKTGDLADNHDILSFNITVDDLIVDELSRFEQETPVVVAPKEVEPDLAKLHRDVEHLFEMVEKLEHTFEHKIAGVDSNLKNMIRQLEKDEEKMLERIQSLETRNTNELVKRIAAVEKRFEGKIEATFFETGGWKIPLVLVFVLVCAVGFVNWRSMNKLNRRDKII